MKYLLVLSWMIISILCYGTSAYKIKNFPIPQEIKYLSGNLESKNFKIQSSLKLDKTNIDLLNTLFPITPTSKKNTPIIISKLDDNAAVKQVSGAYIIDVFSNRIEIKIFDQAALFYAGKTLENYISKSQYISLPLMQIKDYPDVLYRGTVEGFYGTPWSYEDRVRQLRFYGDIKMNTYIYGPKDDPYHSSPHWRDPYPSDKAIEIKKLVNEANRNYVNFVWAIHPGKDIQWNKKDSINLLVKFEKMYALGVRSFAVFFDDIGGEGTKPEKQAALLNYLQGAFVEKYTDVEPLIMCPTEYNKSWSNPKSGTYLDILGNQLHPAIQIMWTGNRVISDIDQPTMQWINARIKRNAFIWWNFPVSDYVRDHLLMGPVYGNANDIDTMISGFVSNPMERAEASKIGIYGVAAYTWNMKSFVSEKAFDAAIKYMMPHQSWALKIFAENNSDLGPNGHGYRRTETVRMAPVIKGLEQEIMNDSINQTTLSFVKKYFDSIELAPSVIIKQPTNKILVQEIAPWLHQFELLGKAGSSVLDAINQFSKKSKSENWNAYLNANNILQKIKYIDTTENQNPHQAGIETGSLVLTPFVKKTLRLMGSKIVENAAAQSIETKTNEQFFTSISQLFNQPLQATETAVGVSPLLEIVTVQPNEYFGLSWLDNRTATQLKFNFDTKGFEKWGRIEISMDGKYWKNINTKDTVYAKQQKIPTGTKYIRFINRSDSVHQIYLKEFLVQTNSNYNSKDSSLVLDKSMETAILLQANDSFNAAIGNNLKTVELFLETFGQPIEVVSSCNTILYKGNRNYISIPVKALKNCNQIKVRNRGKQVIRVVECLMN